MKQPCEDNILGDEVQNGPIRRKDGGGDPLYFFFNSEKIFLSNTGEGKWFKEKKKKIK